jgi:transcriptional regulator with XRE-family HTH domain
VTAAIRIRSYAQLTASLAARRRALGLRQLDVDEKSGLQGGYVGKIECGDRKLGDLSLPMLLAALDCDLYLAPRSSAEGPGPAERRTHVAPTLGRALALPKPEGNHAP